MQRPYLKLFQNPPCSRKHTEDYSKLRQIPGPIYRRQPPGLLYKHTQVQVALDAQHGCIARRICSGLASERGRGTRQGGRARPMPRVDATDLLLMAHPAPA